MFCTSSFIAQSGQRSLKKPGPLGLVLHHLFSSRLLSVLMNSKKNRESIGGGMKQFWKWIYDVIVGYRVRWGAKWVTTFTPTMPRSYPIKSRITFSDTIPPFPGLFRWSHLLISVLCSLQISFFFRKSPFHIFGSIPVTMPSMRVPALHSKFYCQVFPQIDQVRWILKKWNKAKYLIQSREYILFYMRC